MTLTAPRSRQGKAFLVLAIFAAVAATMGALLWASNAQATFPNSSATIFAQPGGSVTAGQTVSYTFRLTVTAGTTTGTDVDFRVTLPAGSANPHVTAVGAGWTLATCNTAISDGDLVLDECQSAAAVGAGTYDFTVTFQASGSSIAAFNASFVDSDSATLTTLNTAGSTVAAGATVTSATNPPGQPHSFVFNMLAGWTCGSDPTEDATRVCTAADVTLGGTATCTATPPVVGNAVMASPSTVTVTITPTSPALGTCTVGLAIKFQGDPATVTDNCCASTVTATKTFAVAAGSLCHLDLPDAATENAAGNTNGILFIGNTPANGCRQDDIDDATGSFHAACLEGSTLTFVANNAQITWTITAVNGGPVAQSQTSFAGPVLPGEPCVMWASGGVGTQNITATWTSAPGITTTFYWNGACSAGICTLKPGTGAQQPLIKEWNTIDSTKIVGATGDVGDTLAANTPELNNWVGRDCSFTPPLDPGGFCARANLNGTTKDISGVLMPDGLNVSAPGASFIDYTMGSHHDAGGAYSGPVDGAQQTYTISGGCGSVRLENPTQGTAIILSNANLLTYTTAPPPGPYAAAVGTFKAAVVNSSDKGVAFQVLPNGSGALLTTIGNGNCQPDDCVTVTIDTQEAGLFHSPPLISASRETIKVCFHVGPPTNKQPLLAWAGQRVVLEHDWSFTDINGVRSCPFGVRGQLDFFVRYVKESGNGALISDLGHGAASGPDFMVVRVSPLGDSNVDPEDNCISRVIYEAQDQGEQDVVAHVVQCAPVIAPASVQADGLGGSVDPDTCTVVSEQVAFLMFYMKFEDVTLKLLPDSTTHGKPPAVSSTAVNPPAGAGSTTANVSANVLARASVRGWVLADNCPARVSRVGSNGEFIPANRCIFPDDWNFKAGGAVALETRPNYDIYGGLTVPCTASVAGPFSQLDAPGCPPPLSLAPHAPRGDGQRETNFPDGVINADDAPMPSALMRFLLTGSGFLIGASKHNATSQFDVTHIPAEPWISRVNADLSGYQWNSWGTGPKSGVYHYWTDFADHGPEVLSCGGASPCSDGVPTGGFLQTRVYSDEHGNAMTWINGDANLDFSKCAHSAATAGHKVVLLKGFFCQSGDVVGTSTINALADYPDKRKHFAIVSGDATISWTWGGIKSVTVVDDPADSTHQFHYVVLHVTDRDGFCQGNSLHPVLGEEVDFRIDSTTGVILPDVNGNSAEGPAFTVSADAKSAITHTFDTALNKKIQDGGITVQPVVAVGECQAWIHVSESQLKPVNVVVTAFDPEGTVTFDTQDINPTPTPSPTPAPPTPTPTPRVLHLKWGDTDCDGTVAPRDAQAILKRVLEQPELSVNQPCPGLGQQIIVAGHTQRWADWDCSGDITPRDAQAVLKNVLAQTAISQTQPCPVMGSAVDVQVISLP